MSNRKIFALLLFFLCLPSSAWSYPEKSLYELPLNWTDEAGEKYELKKYAGSHVLISMVYLSCKASCPLIIGKLRSIEKKLKAKNLQAHFVLVSFDPERDTPAVMAEFKRASELSDNWHLLHANSEQVKKLALLLGYQYKRITDTPEFNHSNRIVLLDKEGVQILALDRLEASIDELVSTLLKTSS